METAHTEELYVFVAIELLGHCGMGCLCIRRGWDQGLDMISEKGLKHAMRSHTNS